jgi:hypothetical protein
LSSNIPPPQKKSFYIVQEFSNRVLEGFQVTPTWHQGFIRDDGRQVASHVYKGFLLLFTTISLLT